ncbi:hypothetical protein J2T49_003962 [Pseudomonas nitroreducens]|nr:hypothetical protein [Pseudomonas nitroreducens]
MQNADCRAISAKKTLNRPVRFRTIGRENVYKPVDISYELCLQWPHNKNKRVLSHE